jgi:hypothetical protein
VVYAYENMTFEDSGYVPEYQFLDEVDEESDHAVRNSRDEQENEDENAAGLEDGAYSASSERYLLSTLSQGLSEHDQPNYIPRLSRNIGRLNLTSVMTRDSFGLSDFTERQCQQESSTTDDYRSVYSRRHDSLGLQKIEEASLGENTNDEYRGDAIPHNEYIWNDQETTEFVDDDDPLAVPDLNMSEKKSKPGENP